MRHQGGLDALSDQLRAAAERSYARWTDGRPQLRERHDLSDYVSYVQDRHAEAEPDEAPAAQGDQPGGIAPAAAPAVDGIAPAGTDDREARRRAHLESVLSGHYTTPSELATLVQRVELDLADRSATLHLIGGGKLVDRGDRIEHVGRAVSPEAAAAIAAAAAGHGWQRVKLTGSVEFRDAVASACALRVPPLASDHTLSPEAQDRVATALRERAAAGIPALDTTAVQKVAAADPAAAARMFLDNVEARSRASLTGRPTGSTDPSELARPRIADLTARREQAREDTREAVAAAAGHRAAHPWTSRILDGASRRRQAALDDEAVRLDREARRLDRGHEKAVHSVEKDARRMALATAAGIEDWRWSKQARGAEAQLAHVERTRAAIAAGDEIVIAAGARGDLRGAGAAALEWEAAREKAFRDARDGLSDPRSDAIRALHAEELRSANPAQLASARQVTAAAIAGDPDTIDAAARGDLPAAQQSAQEWKTANDKAAEEKRRRDHGREHARTAALQPDGVTY